MVTLLTSSIVQMVTLLTSSIYKHMLFKRQSKNRAFFQNYFDLRPPGKREERKLDPGATKVCEFPGVARGMVRLGID